MEGQGIVIGSLCLSVYITSKLYIRPGSYFHTRWHLSQNIFPFFTNTLHLLHTEGDSTERDIEKTRKVCSWLI